jgi:hypothetical protein
MERQRSLNPGHYNIVELRANYRKPMFMAMNVRRKAHGLPEKPYETLEPVIDQKIDDAYQEAITKYGKSTLRSWRAAAAAFAFWPVHTAVNIVSGNTPAEPWLVAAGTALAALGCLAMAKKYRNTYQNIYDRQFLKNDIDHAPQDTMGKKVIYEMAEVILCRDADHYYRPSKLRRARHALTRKIGASDPAPL